MDHFDSGYSHSSVNAPKCDESPLLDMARNLELDTLKDTSCG